MRKSSVTRSKNKVLIRVEWKTKVEQKYTYRNSWKGRNIVIWRVGKLKNNVNKVNCPNINSENNQRGFSTHEEILLTEKKNTGEGYTIVHRPQLRRKVRNALDESYRLVGRRQSTWRQRWPHEA